MSPAARPTPPHSAENDDGGARPDDGLWDPVDA
jgi:hypothetical protein